MAKRPSYLDPDIEDWVLETWAWLMHRFGGVRQLKWAPLVTPERQFFPPTTSTGHERAQHVFNAVRRLMGCDEMECELAPPEAMGLTSDDDGPHVIQYSDVGRPMKLVSEMAHGFAAGLIWPEVEDLPGGEDVFWPACSVAVTYKGLGVFAANAALEAWGVHRELVTDATGYVSEQTACFQLAVYLALTDRRGEADRWLGATERGLVADADAYLRRHPERLDPLRAII